MIPFLIAGEAALLVGVVIGVFWNEIKDFISQSLKRIQDIIIPASIVGFKTYLHEGNLAKALYQAGQVAIQKFYSRSTNGQWKETVLTRAVSFQDIPQDIKMQLQNAHGRELEVSQRVAEELKLEH